MTIYPRPVYILLRFGESLGSVATRFCNAVVFGGSTHQSVSARAWIEGESDPRWLSRRGRIDAFFRVFGQEDHCYKYWLGEVESAKKTLAKAGFTLLDTTKEE